MARPAFELTGIFRQHGAAYREQPARAREQYEMACTYSRTVVLQASIGRDGIPRNIEIVRSLGLGLDEQAVECVSKWRFEPGLKNGKAVEVRETFEVNFRLP